MNIEEEKKAREFYLDSDIQGLHTIPTNTVELNYLDLLKLMHNYAQSKGEILPIDSVSNCSCKYSGTKGGSQCEPCLKSQEDCEF